jgi:hypothetical protein
VALVAAEVGKFSRRAFKIGAVGSIEHGLA